MYKFIFLLCLILSLWNCVRQDIELQPKTLISTKASDNDKIFDESVPQDFFSALEKMKQNQLGRKLAEQVRKMLIAEETIKFSVIPNDNPNIAKLQYGGYGRMYYTETVLRLKIIIIDDLLFHEFFHLFQNNNLSPKKSLNNEVEAYVAQYLYVQSTGDQLCATMIDPDFSLLIAELATSLDNLGNIKSDINRTKFNETYKKALERLSRFHDYQDEDWTANTNPSAFNFSNIVRLLNPRL